LFEKYRKFVTAFARIMNYIAAAALVLMVILVVADIAGNKFFKTPVPGGIELVSLFSVVAIAFAIAQTQIAHGHIEVEMLLTKMPRNVQQVILVFVYSLCVIVFLILAGTSIYYGLSLKNSGEVSMTLGIPFYPFVWGMTLCCVSVMLVFLMQIIDIIRGQTSL